VLLCRRLDLYGRELLAVDGTRIKAVNNKDRSFTRNSLQDFIRAADERLDDYLRRLDEGDVEENGRRRAREKPCRQDRGAAREALSKAIQAIPQVRYASLVNQTAANRSPLDIMAGTSRARKSVGRTTPIPNFLAAGHSNPAGENVSAGDIETQAGCRMEGWAFGRSAVCGQKDDNV
jgi:hypothetical protein